jgi:prolyl 4-hydroxylase
MLTQSAPASTPAVIDVAKQRLMSATPEDVASATTLLRDAAAEGMADADTLLASLAAAGIGQSQNWALAVDHLRRAADAGSKAARAQLDVLGDDSPTPWEAWTAPSEKRTLNDAPKAVAIDQFIGPKACDWIIARSAGRMKPAVAIAQSGPDQVRVRGGSSYAMSFVECDVIVLLLRMRIAACIGVPVGALEEPQVLHYSEGQQFKRHYDYLHPDDPKIATEGQRLATFLVYLNGAYLEGETEFLDFNLRHKGERGSALYFANLLPDGAPDPRSIHAGRAPKLGEKWVFSQWIRNRARI